MALDHSVVFSEMARLSEGSAIAALAGLLTCLD
jgi:hypothetical protein